MTDYRRPRLEIPDNPFESITTMRLHLTEITASALKETEIELFLDPDAHPAGIADLFKALKQAGFRYSPQINTLLPPPEPK